MKDYRLTPEQARAASQMIARVAEGLRRFTEAVRALARRAGEAMANVLRLAKQIRPALACPHRPAWQSPYGPAQGRH